MLATIRRTVEANVEVLEELSARLIDRPGSIVPFVGAGMSIPYGMPGWIGFLQFLLDFVERERTTTPAALEKIRRALTAGRVEKVAQHLYAALGEPKFRTALQSRFRLGERSPTAAMNHIIDLAGGLIITTNYDRAVEVAWRHAFARRGIGQDVEPLLSSSAEDLNRALNGSRHAVLKLHGDVERPETWVLTADRYADVYGGAAFKHFLSRLFSAHIPLFVGCSMTEERILEVMRKSACVGYAVLAAPESEDARIRLAARLKDCVRVVWLRAEDVARPGSVFDLVEPLLHWLCVRRMVGRITWRAETRPVAAAWASTLDRFESRGEYAAATQSIERYWQEWHSWELAVEYLRLADLAGNPTGWQTFVTRLRPSLRDDPTPVTQHALDYMYGRLLGQTGHWTAAFSCHAANRPQPPNADRYQVLSWFEQGQLRYRTEDFERAQRVFEDVYYLLLGQITHEKLLVDVLKFLGTIQVLDIIYDAPGADNLWIAGTHSDPQLALAYADAALQTARSVNYADGIAWAHCVMAFAYEARHENTTAERLYADALAVAQSEACRSATRLHILFYEAGFFRRMGRLDDARTTLNSASYAMLRTGRTPDRMRLAEQHLLLAWSTRDADAARTQLDVIAELHALAPILLDGSTRLERRIARLQADRRGTG